MRISRQKITIITVKKPNLISVNTKLQWLGSSLGLFNLRDKDKSCFRIFIEVIKAAKSNENLSSDEIAFRLNLSRGTVVHHINKLIEAGIVVPEGKKYVLRVNNLKELVNEIEKDINRTMDDLKLIADDVDKWLGL